jgi:hypothetical protein
MYAYLNEAAASLFNWAGHGAARQLGRCRYWARRRTRRLRAAPRLSTSEGWRAGPRRACPPYTWRSQESSVAQCFRAAACRRVDAPLSLRAAHARARAAFAAVPGYLQPLGRGHASSPTAKRLGAGVHSRCFSVQAPALIAAAAAVAPEARCRQHVRRAPQLLQPVGGLHGRGEGGRKVPLCLP